jgi:hypothetical protein
MLDAGSAARKTLCAARIGRAENVTWRLFRRRLKEADWGDAMTLPTFVVIGAMKAGTVSLRHYLDEHPEVFVATGGRFGEPNFFVAEFNWPRGRERR